MPQNIAALFQQWYKREYENNKILKPQTMVCQIFDIRYLQEDVYEIQICDSKNIFTTKIYKYALQICCDKINKNVRNQLSMLRGALVTLECIEFLRVKNSLRFEILILEMNYIDGLGGKIANQIQLQGKEPLIIKFEERSLPCYQVYHSIFEKLIEAESKQIHEQQQLKKKQQQDENMEAQIPKAFHLVYDASQFPEQNYLEQSIKSQFKFVPFVTLRLTSRFSKLNK